MKLLIFLLFPFYLFASDPISCAPDRKVAAAQVSSVRDGDWFSGSTWSTGKVPAETDDVTINHKVTSNNKSIIVRGRLSGSQGGIFFKGINTKLFIDGPTDMTKPINSWFTKNIGLYVLDNGQLNLIGEEKTPWTYSVSGLTKGTTQFQVTDAKNWKEGDEIFISPTRMPQVEPGLGENDQFAKEFERRIIKGISGNAITIDPLVYDHLMVDNQFTAEIGNITRSFIITGEKGRETHIFMHSRLPQTIRNIEIVHTGGDRETGVYGNHFHHMRDGSRGTIVEGNAAHDNNFRVFVPHESHGITINNNVSFDQYGESLWYDFQTVTHDAVWTNNLIALTRVRPGVLVSEAVNLGQGENNVCNNNVVVYGSTTNARIGDRAALGITPLLENRGAYNWHADNMGRPWEFKGNIAHSNMVAAWLWINSPWAVHQIQEFTAYNNWRGAFNGAYINGIALFDSYFYDSPVELKATSGTTIGNSVVRTRMVSSGKWRIQTIDRKGTIIPAVAYVQDSPIPSGSSNKFVDCSFEGAVGLICFSPKKDGDQFKQPKWVELLGCKFTGIPYQIHASAHKSTRVTSGPNPGWGTGIGLTAEFFPNTNLSGEGIKYIDHTIRHYSTWIKTIMESPTGPSRMVNGDNFSVRWSGYYEPLTTGQHSFEFEGSAGVRIWVDDRLILDSWVDKVKETDVVKSSSIALVKGNGVPIKVEAFNAGGKRRAWVRVNGSDLNMFQLYPQITPDTIVITPPKPNLTPLADAGPDLIDTTLSFLIRGTATDDGLITVDWNKLSGGNISYQKQTNPAELYLQDFEPGVFEFEMVVTDSAGLIAKDTVKVTALAPPPVIDPCKTFVESEYLAANKDVADAVKKRMFPNGLAHYNRYGKNEPRLLSLKCVFQSKEQTGSLTCVNGKDTTIFIPAGKHQAASQALADALALQELNNALSNSCPVEIARYELQGRTIIIYSDWTIILK